MSSIMDFQEFPKVPRFSRDIVITEKIDGTNAQIAIVKAEVDDLNAVCRLAYGMDDFNIYAGSRTRWLSLESDNHGFAQWVANHMTELVKLGEGRHFGEWWGAGINRGYDQNQKWFSLFNTKRWSDEAGARPDCCLVVPTLYEGPFHTEAVEDALDELRKEGSRAAFGFKRPEGVVVFHTAANMMFKKTLDNDEHKTFQHK